MPQFPQLLSGVSADADHEAVMLFGFFSQANNPLYKEATSTFTNITYRGNM